MRHFSEHSRSPALSVITPLWLVLAFCTGCTDDKATSLPAAALNPTTSPPHHTNSNGGSGTLAPAPSNFLDMSAAAVAHYCETNTALTTSMTNYVNTPSAELLLATRTAWQQAHESLMRISYLRYLPVDHPVLDHLPVITVPNRTPSTETGNQRLRIWQTLDQTPMLGGYLDYVKFYPFSGIVNSEIEISEQTLRHEFQFSDDMYVTTGFHPAEFMLWGEDGSRTIADFIVAPENTEDHNLRAARRLDLIKAINTALIADSDKLCAAWTATQNHYVSKIRQYAQLQQLEIVLQTLKGALQRSIASELSQYIAGATSDYHSPYSANSMNDLKAAFYSINKILQEPALQAALSESVQATTEPTQPMAEIALQIKDIIERLAQSAEKNGADQQEKDDVLQAEKALTLINDIVVRIDTIIDTQ